MRVAAIRDIHGNLPAEVVDLLVGRGARCVRGNADREVVERSDRYPGETTTYFESHRGA